MMIIELRKKSQITIPKEVITNLKLQEGDHLDVSIKNGVICLEPIAVYSKAYVEKLEQTVMMINENPEAYAEGPFTSVEDAIEYLESEGTTQGKEKKKINK